MSMPRSQDANPWMKMDSPTELLTQVLMSLDHLSEYAVNMMTGMDLLTLSEQIQANFLPILNALLTKGERTPNKELATTLVLRYLIRFFLMTEKNHALLARIVQCLAQEKPLDPENSNVFVILFPSILQVMKNHSIEWSKTSVEELEKLFKDISGGFPTSVPTSDMRQLKEWLSFFAETSTGSPSARSSGTKKRKRGQDTSTSTTRASSPDPTADAGPSRKRSSRESETSSGDDTSNEELDDEYFTATASQKPIGVTGCNITCEHQGKYYTWKSEKCPKWKSYIDLKVYPDVKALKKCTDVSKQWQCATYRAKICLGNPLTPDLTRRTAAALKELKSCLLESAQNFPGVVKDCKEKSNRT